MPTWSTATSACFAAPEYVRLGASILRDKLKKAGLPDVKVEFKAVAQLEDGADIVISQRELTDRARHQAPTSRHVSVDNFLSSPVYDDVVAEAKASDASPS